MFVSLPNQIYGMKIIIDFLERGWLLTKNKWQFVKISDVKHDY